MRQPLPQRPLTRRDARESEPCRPPLGALEQRVHDVVRGVAAGVESQERRGLVPVERQIEKMELRQLARHTQAAERQLRVDARAHGDLRVRRQVPQKERDHVPGSPARDGLRVVQHKDEGPRPRQRVREQRQHLLAHRRHRQSEVLRHGRAELSDGGHGLSQHAEKDDGVVVVGVEPQPGRRSRIGLQPLHEDRRLARPGRRSQQDERLTGACETGEESAPLDQLEVGRRRIELGLRGCQRRLSGRGAPTGV